jgi:hypothetical protein
LAQHVVQDPTVAEAAPFVRGPREIREVCNEAGRACEIALARDLKGARFAPWKIASPHALRYLAYARADGGCAAPLTEGSKV